MAELKLTSEQERRALDVYRRATVIDMLWSTNPAQPTPVLNGKNVLDRVVEAGLA
ncbi:MAG: hypothetical protein HY660_02560, partial [Armatimonadetes bacterium]|nr:hypothetical protein [Armatimonadota bacterium]